MDDASMAMATSRKSRMDVVYFTEELMYRSMLRRKIVTRFPDALRNGELEAFYQPKVSRENYRLCGCEALARWRADGVVHMPTEFIPALEEAGLMIQLDFHILEQVCRDIRSWLDEGITPVRVSVNYSKRDLMEEDLAERTLEVIRRWGIDPCYLEIEFTETTGYVDAGLLSTFVQQMRSSGVTVSMDDFGTGYSSVNLFKSLDFDVVKLDRSFIHNIDRHIIRDEVILENIIQMLHELNCEIVAEGVETERQMGFLRNTACQVIQGFYFDQPMPRQEFVTRLVNPQYAR
jgi:EAL domain-containing protein (putative c-di-GMP-specific phosphodiesterase class I)